MVAKVSIVIPAYNRAKVIGETLESVLNQTEENFECLVVDDCSTDETTQIVAGFQRRDGRIHLIRNETNRGACYSRNRGLELAKGKFICFLDSDDLLDVNYLAAQCTTLDNFPDRGLAVCQTLRFHGRVDNADAVYGGLEPPITLARYLQCQISWSTASALWRVPVVKKVGGFPLQLPMHQDWELNARYLASGGTVAITPKTLVYYRDQWEPQQITARNKNDRLRVFSLYKSRKMVFYYALKMNSLKGDARLALSPHFINLPSQLFKYRYYWQTFDSLFASIYLSRHLYPLKKFMLEIIR
ncbi:MAG: glycosyltransferase family 2 protein [Moorea sp. SIOASIH]|uniref:glycosyltransferase family 2 protein n=1 Tax=Moorena sp. SIOASIH TaxID=2607817 RepID=UPI0013BC724E|nr:glycosyltransferase family A protein [Moorena sp. SIOASIH]NEO36144.1 glycosyltransferase family 2 protein [Moorena sp. SIOASIH]